MIKFINENLKGLVYLCIIFFFLTACARVPRVNRYGLPQREYVYQEPEATDDGWEISSLRGEGVEEQKLHEMMHEILSGNSRYVHSILLIKNGKLIFEEYFFGYGRDTDHFLASVSKSVTSLIIGVAINKGYVPDVDTLAYEIFSDYYWDQFPDGTIQTDGGLYLRPRDMAKIGYMVLQKGQWRGRQIVSQEWIAESTQTYINGLGVGYGYQWRIGKALINGQTIEVLYASGHGGQKIFIIPQLDVVAVFTSKVFNPTGHTGPEKMLVKYILPAFIPTGESPEIVKLDSGLLDKLTGKYKIKNIDAVIPVVREGDTLYAKTGFWEKFELLPENENRFHGSSKKFGDFQVDVINDEYGNVRQLIAHFELRSIYLDKVE